MRKLTIAIDGPSGAGKGTVARAIAHALGYRHVDSGAMYRAVGWQAVHAHVALEDEPAVARIAERARIEIVPDGDARHGRFVLERDVRVDRLQIGRAHV
jgi:cytidylate kinase